MKVIKEEAHTTEHDRQWAIRGAFSWDEIAGSAFTITERSGSWKRRAEPLIDLFPAIATAAAYHTQAREDTKTLAAESSGLFWGSETSISLCIFGIPRHISLNFQRF
ncbi:unnamed protein product [Cercospora beticola]|nr:unnamed protein product [Cercospora beticola]